MGLDRSDFAKPLPCAQPPFSLHHVTPASNVRNAPHCDPVDFYPATPRTLFPDETDGECPEDKCGDAIQRFRDPAEDRAQKARRGAVACRDAKSGAGEDRAKDQDLVPDRTRGRRGDLRQKPYIHGSLPV